MANLDLASQVRLFAGASASVALHGAGEAKCPRLQKLDLTESGPGAPRPRLREEAVLQGIVDGIGSAELSLAELSLPPIPADQHKRSQNNANQAVS